MNERHWFLGGADLLVAFLLTVFVWVALPARYWPVDLGMSALAAAFVVSGIGLLWPFRWGARIGRIVGGVAFAAGMCLVTALAWTASYLAGLYGPVGKGGALILIGIACLLLPYLVILPAAQVWFLSGRRLG